MESGLSNQTGGFPPALPVKHHRQRSAGSNCGLLSPGLQPPNNTLNDVFESTDCHATSCPIHRDADSAKHQVRFLSDDTPPPVPRKRLVRTLSLPADRIPPLSPTSPCLPRQMHPHNFDNPLYMLSPAHDRHSHSKGPPGLGVADRSSTVPLLPLSKLSFDTSDEHLGNFFVMFKDQNAVSQALQHRHLLFLRDVAQRMTGNVLLKEEKPLSSYQPQDFLLDEGSEPKAIAGRIYYSVHSPKFPGRTLGLRICTQTDMPASTCTRPKPAHVNLEQTVAHFQPTSSVMDSCMKAQLVDSSCVSGCTAAASPCGLNNEYANYSGSSLMSTVQHLLWKGCSVDIERDLPSATLEDFVQEGHSLQNVDCVLYDRRLCFLLLQILQGTQHLYRNNSGAPGLTPPQISLVWLDTNKAKSESSKTKNSKKEAINNVGEIGQEGSLQRFWETQGCPRVVISSQKSGLPVSKAFVSIKSDLRVLIQYCLKAHKGLAALYMSTYRKALLHLESQLTDISRGLHIDDMVSVLQVVLWGPGAPLVEHIGMSAVHSWLAVKRALLVMKLAEKGVDSTALDWEDILCLQYVAFTEPENVVNASKLA